ncbi:hypothetical protein HYPSUDRAFT_538032 [Hypholoma sublateritium FD-334 SS-4]|uniref:F-box domain-containing protein n=1 Tax=Hypholoma sublateritium (strain FD-334 SS-4) TaxID=945553 RepID=A0A0D2MKK4_HYPSF|nr:hypothetical protein HYPSUDRAFT_538032 [Hypholoma sublateritium FD-334 SS-4]
MMICYHTMSLLTLPEGVDDCLMDALSPRELLRYSRTCKTAYSIVQNYMKHAFCVDRLLSRYFSPAEINRFRELQYRTGALISGSTALQFFDSNTYPDSDLDVYVEHRFVRTLTDWLVDIGYKYTPLSDSADMATLDAPTPLGANTLLILSISSRERTTPSLLHSRFPFHVCNEYHRPRQSLFVIPQDNI